MTFGNQISKSRTSKINAEIKGYKFLIEKKGNDTVMDITFNTTVGKKD
jgi:hypothetical protein